MHHSPSFSLAFKTFQIMNLNTIIIRINKAIPILKSQFGYPDISILSTLSSSINNSINIENVINKNNMMMMMNAFAAFYHPDLHAGSSSHSQEPPSQTINVDVFGSRNNNNRKKKRN
jgi:Na+/citrate or Na+/malate symporter